MSACTPVCTPTWDRKLGMTPARPETTRPIANSEDTILFIVPPKVECGAKDWAGKCGGLSIEETAAVIGVSLTTVKDDLNLAKAWLRREIGGGKPK